MNTISVWRVTAPETGFPTLQEEITTDVVRPAISASAVPATRRETYMKPSAGAFAVSSIVGARTLPTR